jgi:hypothetical protein
MTAGDTLKHLSGDLLRHHARPLRDSSRTCRDKGLWKHKRVHALETILGGFHSTHARNLRPPTSDVKA